MNYTSIKDLPAEERPRERLLRQGASSLSNAELIAVLLGGGTAGLSAVGLAEKILAADESGIRILNDCVPEELYKIEGVGPARAACLMAAAELGRRLHGAPKQDRVSISSPEKTAALFMSEMRYQKKEMFKVLLLNTKNEIIGTDDVSVGSLASSPAHPREVFAKALRRSAANVILVHNHPSGNPQPSREDILLTERLAKAGELLGIKVLDHIIIGDGEFTSLFEAGQMSWKLHTDQI